jgi:hypothetical protein
MATTHTHHAVPTKSGEIHEARYNENIAAGGISYYTPAQAPPAGAAINPETAPKVFQPLRIRGMTMQNRVMVSCPSLTAHLTETL